MVSETNTNEIDVYKPMDYEIRVRGHLDSPHWLEWFENMTVSVNDRGETIFRVPVSDQAALYGILARIRDLGVPLVAVQMVRPVSERGLRINWLMASVYVLLIGGLSGLVVYFSAEGILRVALALTVFFAASGGIALAMRVFDRGWGWQATAATAFASAGITFLIDAATMGWLHPALVGFIVACSMAGGLLAWSQRQKKHPVIDWEALDEKRNSGERQLR